MFYVPETNAGEGMFVGCAAEEGSKEDEVYSWENRIRLGC